MKNCNKNCIIVVRKVMQIGISIAKYLYRGVVFFKMEYCVFYDVIALFCLCADKAFFIRY